MRTHYRAAIIIYVVTLAILFTRVPWQATVNGRTFRLSYGLVWSGPSIPEAAPTLPGNFDFERANLGARLAPFARPDFGRIGLNLGIVSAVFALSFWALPLLRS